MWKLLKKSKNIKNDLLNFKDEPLTSISILLLVVLNIFILYNVLIGVQAEMDKAPKSSYYYPYICSKHFDVIQITYKGLNNYKYSEYNSIPITKSKSKYCEELNKKIDIFRFKKSFKMNFKLIKTIENKKRQNKQRLLEISQKYNTRLFETIARMPNNKALNYAKNEYDAIILNNNDLNKELKYIPQVSSMSGYNDYVKYVKNNQDVFAKAKESYQFWQPFKAYIHMLIFIIPLLIFFGFFYYRTKKQQLMQEVYNPIVKIISANISLILSLPLIWYTLTLIYYILPKTFLKNLIEFLVSIGLISVLNYILISLVVLFFGGLIYYIQKRISNLKQDIPNNIKKKKLISWSKCFNCELKINYDNKYCPFCRIELHKKCKLCNNKMIVHEPYCSNCGNMK